MKIVIELSDEDYKRIQDIPDVFNSLTSKTYSAIRNGTPLPEHYGRLVDADALMKSYSQFEFCSDMGDAMEILDNVPTIIERSNSE